MLQVLKNKHLNNHQRHKLNFFFFTCFSAIRNTHVEWYCQNDNFFDQTQHQFIWHLPLWCCTGYKLQVAFCQICPELCHFQLLSDFILPRAVVMEACIPWHLVTQCHTTPATTIFLIFWANPKPLISNLSIHSVNISFVGE
jgi:hypothetical protein